MDRIQFVLNSLAQQRNDALDAFVSARADLAVAAAELEAAKARIAELEAQLPKPPAEAPTDGP